MVDELDDEEVGMVELPHTIIWVELDDDEADMYIIPLLVEIHQVDIVIILLIF